MGGMSKRDEMTALARKYEAASVPIRAWTWIEQGGAFVSTVRPPANGEGGWAEPLVSAKDVTEVLRRREGRGLE